LPLNNLSALTPLRVCAQRKLAKRICAKRKSRRRAGACSRRFPHRLHPPHHPVGANCVRPFSHRLIKPQQICTRHHPRNVINAVPYRGLGAPTKFRTYPITSLRCAQTRQEDLALRAKSRRPLHRFFCLSIASPHPLHHKFAHLLGSPFGGAAAFRRLRGSTQKAADNPGVSSDPPKIFTRHNLRDVETWRFAPNPAPFIYTQPSRCIYYLQSFTPIIS